MPDTLPRAETACMLFWVLLASGQNSMRRVDGWDTMHVAPADQPHDPTHLKLRRPHLQEFLPTFGRHLHSLPQRTAEQGPCSLSLGYAFVLRHVKTLAMA